MQTHGYRHGRRRMGYMPSSSSRWRLPRAEAALKRATPAPQDDPFLHGSMRGMQGVVDASVFFLHSSLCGSADMDDSYAGKALSNLTS